MTRIVKVLLLIAYLRIASAVLPTDDVGIVGFCDEMTNTNLQLLTTPSSPFERRGGVVSLTLSLPDMNDKTRISTDSVGLNCESKLSSTCGNGLKCYHCGNSAGFDGHFVVNKETDFLIGVLSNAIDDTKFEIRTDGKARNVQSRFRYRGVSMKDVKISVGGISVPNEEMSTVTLGPNDHRSAVREAYAPVRSAEALPTKRTDVDRVGRELSPASDDGSVVDLLYYFSRRAACQWLEKDGFCTLEAEDQSELETLVGEINDYGNTALSNSQIPTSFNVVKVHVDLVYDEGTSISSIDRLNWVAGSVEAANLRDEYKADLVVDVFYYYLQGYTNYASGIGMTPNFFPSRANGYSSTGGTFMFLDETITHEIGHNFGANHDRYNVENIVADESFYGHVNCNKCFGTIMSYQDKCVELEECTSVDIIPYFSNPNLKYEGVSMGDDDNNNALQLTRSAPGIAINQYSYGKSIFITSNYDNIFADAQLMAVKFDIVPKKNLILKNIQLEVSTDMKISVYIVAGPYADVTEWGVPIVTETLTPLGKLSTKLRNVASYVSFPYKSLDANQVYAVRIERQDNDTKGYMEIAGVQNEDDYFENNDVTVRSGKFVDFDDNEYKYIVGLQGRLIYDDMTTTPITSSPTSSPKTSTPNSSPTFSPTSVDCEDDTKIKFLVGPDKKKCNKIKASQCDTEYETKKDGKKKPENECPSICNPKCLCFEDKNKKYKLKGKDKKFKCKKIEKKELCETKVKGTDGKKANKVCPVSCKYNDCT
mmetsp:Transcript_25331/g.28998  ORF Transcript_25331/g.28998 Transcript_25331/m.28998 type:complete len:765 (-) Transcript_25331:57-2351(-)